MKKITEFRLRPGDLLAQKYEVIGDLGSGWEGEVYKIRERNTGIERAAKLFFPHRNKKQQTSRFYARKLHKLRQCRILIQYHTEETIFIDGIPVTALISEYVEGRILYQFVQSLPGKRVPPFQALHILHALAKGIEEIHLLNEYHGDLHMDNIIVNRYGLRIEFKLLDMFHWGRPTRENRDKDLTDLIRIFYDCLGGIKTYSKMPPAIKHICCGLKTSLVLQKFRTVSQLREHIETMTWDAA